MPSANVFGDILYVARGSDSYVLKDGIIQKDEAQTEHHDVFMEDQECPSFALICFPNSAGDRYKRINNFNKDGIEIFASKIWNYTRRINREVISCINPTGNDGILVPTYSPQEDFVFMFFNNNIHIDTRLLGRYLIHDRYNSGVCHYFQNEKRILSGTSLPSILTRTLLAEAYMKLQDDEIMVLYDGGGEHKLYGFSSELRLVEDNCSVALFSYELRREPFVSIIKKQTGDMVAQFVVSLKDQQYPVSTHSMVVDLHSNDFVLDVAEMVECFSKTQNIDPNFNQFFGKSETTREIVKALKNSEREILKT